MSQAERALDEDVDELDDDFGDVELFDDEVAEVVARTDTDEDRSPEEPAEPDAVEADVDVDVEELDDADESAEVLRDGEDGDEEGDDDAVTDAVDEAVTDFDDGVAVVDSLVDPLITPRRDDETSEDVDLRGDDEVTDDDADLSDDVLEELRRAEIDGPTVGRAPQDDTSSGIRRPQRAPDYDPAPFPIPMQVPRVLGRRPRVRRVTRVVRHVDPWSVFKIAIVANLVLYLIVLTAGVLLWNVAYATGTVDNVERFFESFGWSEFEFNGGEIYHNAWIGGLFLVIGFTGLAVLFATLFNLITDLVGGMRFTVLEEEVVEARTSPLRRFVVRRAEPEVPAVTYDESGPIVREGVVDDDDFPR